MTIRETDKGSDPHRGQVAGTCRLLREALVISDLTNELHVWRSGIALGLKQRVLAVFGKNL